MRDLYRDLIKKHKFARFSDPEDKIYSYICSILLQNHDFLRNELYQDNDRMILRSTIIDVKLYNKMLENIDLGKLK
jgi:hypothetical protein